MTRFALAIVIAGVFLVIVFPVNAVDIENGRALYEQHCTGCHNESVFQRSDRLVNTEKQLLERIRQCELSNELAWFEEEIRDVAAYIGRNFYGFAGKENN